MKACYGELNVSFDSDTSPTEPGSQNSITILQGNSTQSKEIYISEFKSSNSLCFVLAPILIFKNAQTEFTKICEVTLQFPQTYIYQKRIM